MKSKIFWSLLAIAFLLIVPDILFSFFNESFKLSHDPKVILLLAPLSLGLFANRFKWLSYTSIILLAAVQTMQFSSLAYFGNWLSPYSICLLSQEISDTFLEVSNVFPKYYYVLIIVLIPFCAIYYLMKKNSKHSIWGTLILICTICSFGYEYFHSARPRFNPNGVRFSIDNSLKAFWGYVTIKCKNFDIKKYKPYEIIDLNKSFDEQINIIYIIEESVNYNHMSLFEYKRKTTPKLDELAKSEDVFVTKAIAGGISTVSSCKFIMNVLREADNPIQASKTDTNLFRLAKLRGFKTFYISTQTGHPEHLLASISGTNYIDVVKIQDLDLITASKLSDDILLDNIKNQKLSNKNFIVLHQRCIHAPYLKSVSSAFESPIKFTGSEDSIIDQYDTAMIYNDFIISKIFNYFNKQTKGKYYIFWASDHNELLGENGLFGHGSGHLNHLVADIPFILQTNDGEFLKEIKNIFIPNQYEITKSIANLLGFQINNPNEDGKTFYISGVDFNGRCGFIKYTKDAKNKTMKHESEIR